MYYLGMGVGLTLGVGGYYLYTRYFSKVYQLGEKLYNQARGDLDKAYIHINRLVP